MYRLNPFARSDDITSPRLWIRRVVLFESPEKKDVPIRNIPFFRGLNIVWGVELPDDAVADGARPVTLSGHSVGKTIQKLKADIAEKRRKEIQLSEYRDRLQRLDYHLNQRQQALDLIEGRTPNTRLHQENARAAELRENIVRKQDELRRLQETYDKHLKSINEIYNALIKNVLSDTYSGALRIQKGELQFHIEEATGLSGEAVETLALILADVVAMICSCRGIGHHPRFLLHDSPREADLDQHIYSRYLRSMWNLTNEYGGQDKAPFQYIVTTTSKPPKEIEAAICLRLEAHPETKMLFGRLLTNPSTNEQLELFGEEDKL
ncbi:MAG: hypothetical protein K6U74_04680 [Firmicutes bacterium]|nr:hypothetical protein [Bacillota bacterium]